MCILITKNPNEIFRVRKPVQPSDANQKDDNFSSIISFRHGISGNLLANTKLNYQNNFSEYSNGAFAKSYYRNIYFSNSSQINFTGNNFELISGYDLSYSALKSNELEDNVKRIQYGLFLVSEFNVNRKIKLFPSARYDYISDIKRSVVSGKLGMNYRPVRDVNLNFKASSATALHLRHSMNCTGRISETKLSILRLHLILMRE
ncbi:MAG: TonB-dependent receptor [Ignavibacteria bacterium]|nr:TonB-dependent receptor [Ignavibacteria bacterium]